MSALGPSARILLAELRRFAGDKRLNARIIPMEWVAIAKKAGLSDQSQSEAITDLLRSKFIAFQPETTQIITFSPEGIGMADQLVREKPKLDDPMPISLEDIQSELDYWEVHLHDGEPESPWWHGVKARIEGLRHREGRFLPGISITNNAIGPNSRINQNSTDQSANTVSSIIASAAGHNQLSDPFPPHTRFRKREESADDAHWQQLSGEFAKLASEEKSANAFPLGVMVVPESKPSSDVADWVMHNGNSENLKARFELLASQGGKALGPMPVGATPFRYWLHRLYQHLRENRSNLSRFFISSGMEAPLIDAVCEASSTFCLRLQKRAIEDDQETKEISARFHDWIVSNHVSVSIPAQISERNRVSLVAESASTTIPIEFLSSCLQEIKLLRGSTEFGSPVEFLHAVAETHGLIWAITQRGLWMAQQPPSTGVYIDAYGKQHGSLVLNEANARSNGREFDLFISHSSVDKPYVTPLVSALKAAEISVWFDENTLEWGDSLRSEIDRGLAACRYGIVVFSKAFLKKKKWTEHELNALFAKEGPGKKVILPIWHGITRDDLIEYSPAFADRLAKDSITDSHGDIVESLLSMLGRPSLVSSPAASEPVKSPPPDSTVANATADTRHDAKGPAPPATRAARSQEHPKHNVVFLSAAFVKIAYSGPGFSPRTDGMHSFSEIEGARKGDMIGLVARFRNEAIYGQEVTAVRAVRAHLKLFDKNNQEIGTGYSSALWLSHPSDTFDLVPNGSGGSVLVCWGSKTTAHVSWKTRAVGDRLHDNDIELNDGYPGKVEVTLMDSNSGPLLRPITLEIAKTAGELSVVVR